MKKIVLGMFMTLAALVFLVSPAAASSPQQAPALGAFLASLATPAPVPAAKRPAIDPKSLCTATANCFPGTVSCSSNTSVSNCSAADRDCGVGEPGHVTCDGVTTSCPTACDDCSDLEQHCDDVCGLCGVKSFVCSPYRCRCFIMDCS